jgi:hypothetical protein
MKNNAASKGEFRKVHRLSGEKLGEDRHWNSTDRGYTPVKFF